MKLIVGLGNPGAQYDRTRHNAGFMVVDRLADRHAAGEVPKSRFHAACVEGRLPSGKCLLMKPTTYMNRSGQSVGEALRFFKLDPEADLVVVVDDLALDVGQIRVRARGGDGGHNGLKDIDRALGGAAYPRVRVGIGARPSVMNQADWVLSRFTEAEWPDFERSVRTAAEAVEHLAAEGVEAAMNRFNEKASGKGPPPTTHPKQADGAAPPDAGGVHPGWTSG